MPREGWKGVNIPEDLHEELAKIVDGSLEYTSVPELVRAVLARFVKNHQKREVAA